MAGSHQGNRQCVFIHDWSTLEDVEAGKISSEHLTVLKLTYDRCGIPLTGFVRELDLREALVDRLLVRCEEAELNFDVMAEDIGE